MICGVPTILPFIEASGRVDTQLIRGQRVGLLADGRAGRPPFFNNGPLPLLFRNNQVLVDFQERDRTPAIFAAGYENHQ
jgi:hypothetical protein